MFDSLHTAVSYYQTNCLAVALGPRIANRLRGQPETGEADSGETPEPAMPGDQGDAEAGQLGKAETSEITAGFACLAGIPVPGRWHNESALPPRQRR
jgi:hypothetical protein